MGIPILQKNSLILVFPKFLFLMFTALIRETRRIYGFILNNSIQFQRDIM